MHEKNSTSHFKEAWTLGLHSLPISMVMTGKPGSVDCVSLTRHYGHRQTWPDLGARAGTRPGAGAASSSGGA